ncbi:tryptophan-rich sensory protein [Methylobacterium sp. BTF04]|nr:tryptophan-rich sensory protein [Methylobacterium sp. BTF04]
MAWRDWNWTPIGIAAAAAIVVAILGGVLTTTGPWYQNLRRPTWKPPDWAFGPIWTTIFTLTAISGVLAWEADASLPARRNLLVAYAVNAVFNIAWSAVFFRMRRPDWAFVEVLGLWLSVLALVVVTLPSSTTAALLLLPYLAWVGVAAYLNLTIVRMNGPFHGA